MLNQLIKKNGIMFLLFAIPFLAGMSIDLYVPSLPYIVDYYHITNSLSQLTISAYMLSYSVGQLFIGPLSDSIGRKKILLMAGILFTLASIFAATASNIYILIICRFLQGLGIAGLAVAIRVFAIDKFKGLALTKVITFASIGWSIGPIIGPFIGGYLQHYFNWQADFYFFGLYGIFILLAIWLIIPETNLNPQPFNLLKTINSIRTVISNPIFLYATIIASLIYSMLVVFNVVGPFLIQKVLNYSVVAYGNIALLLGTAYFLGNTSNRLLINYFKPMRVSFYALSSALIICLMMLLLASTLKMNLYIILVPVWIIFFLNGMIFPNMAGEFSNVYPELAGTVSALSGLFVGGIPFILSSFSTLLKTSSQIPFTILYVGILLACLMMFNKIKFKKITSNRIKSLISSTKTARCRL